MNRKLIIYDSKFRLSHVEKSNSEGKNGRYNDYCSVHNLLKWLRAEVIRNVELAFLKDREAFRLLRKRLLDLFGEAWGAEKLLIDIFDEDDQHQNGQARMIFETCKKGDAHD